MAVTERRAAMIREELVVDDVIVQKVDVYRFGEGSPKVLFTGGLHGGEMTGQYVAFEVIERLKAKEDELSGEVVVIPRANPAAFRRMQRTSPYDERDMNRIFPGKPDGTPTEILANKIWDIAVDMDYIVDLHCCGIYGSPYTLAQYEEYDFAGELADKIDIPVVVQSAGARGQLFVEAALEDIPSVIIELPGGGRAGVIDMAAASRTIEALMNLLVDLAVLPGEVREVNPVFCGPLRRVSAPAHGLFLPQVAPGEAVEEGQVLGSVDGEPLRVDFSGYVIIARPPGYAFRGSPTVVLAPSAEE